MVSNDYKSKFVIAAGRPLKELPDGRLVPDDGEVFLESTIDTNATDRFT